MRHLLSVVLSLVVAAADVSAQTPAPSPSPAASPLPATEPEHKADDACEHCRERMDGAKRAETEKTVLELEQKWCEAEARHDVAFLEKAEADTFTFTDSSGHLTTKKDEIEAAKQGGDKIEFKLSDMKAQIYGDAAILTGQTSFDAGDTGAAPSAYRWTDVFVRLPDGEWQVVASQATAIRQGTVAGQTRDE